MRSKQAYCFLGFDFLGDGSQVRFFCAPRNRPFYSRTVPFIRKDT